MREAERSKNDPGMVGNGNEFLVVCGVGGGGIDACGVRTEAG